MPNKSLPQVSMSTFTLILIVFTMMFTHGSDNRLISEVFSELQSPTYYRNSPGLSSESSGSEDRAIGRLEVTTEILYDQVQQLKQNIDHYRANYLDVNVNFQGEENMVLKEQLNGLYQISHTPELKLHYSKIFPASTSNSSNIKIVWDKELWVFVDFDVEFEGGPENVWNFRGTHPVISVILEPRIFLSKYPLEVGFSYPTSDNEPAAEGSVFLTPLDLYGNQNFHESTGFDTKYLFYSAFIHWNDFHKADGIATFDSLSKKWILHPIQNTVIFTERNVLDLEHAVENAIEKKLNTGYPIKQKMMKEMVVKKEKFVLWLHPLIPTYVTTQKQMHDVELLKRLMFEVRGQLHSHKIAQEGFTLFTKNVDESENTSSSLVNLTTQDNSLFAENQEAKLQMEKLEREKKLLHEEIKNEKKLKEMKEFEFQEQKKEIENQFEIFKQSMETEKKEKSDELERLKNESINYVNQLNEKEKKNQSLKEKLSEATQKTAKKLNDNEKKEKDFKNLQNENKNLLDLNKKLQLNADKWDDKKKAYKDKQEERMKSILKQNKDQYEKELTKKDEEMKKKEEEMKKKEEELTKKSQEDLLAAITSWKIAEKKLEDHEASGNRFKRGAAPRNLPGITEDGAMVATDEGQDDESDKESSHSDDHKKYININDPAQFLQVWFGIEDQNPEIQYIQAFIDNFD
jgi:hypothetical protein